MLGRDVRGVRLRTDGGDTRETWDPYRTTIGTGVSRNNEQKDGR